MSSFVFAICINYIANYCCTIRKRCQRIYHIYCQNSVEDRALNVLKMNEILMEIRDDSYWYLLITKTSSAALARSLIKPETGSKCKSQKLKLPVLIGLLSAVQPPFRGHWATLGNYRPGLLGELFHSRFCVQPRAPPRCIKLEHCTFRIMLLSYTA